ncbi:MAG: YsnF/AvaK domain-containing protein, partial [Acetobacteraceae bacterium]|nr:YsnF/AvaK domain-containing protein [Acetobacteraceae bacterium]
MATETIVAVFNTADEAQAAIRALEAAGVPSDSIRHYARGDEASTDRPSTETEYRPGFWAWILGEEGDYQNHRTVYDRTYESGGTVVTVVVPEQEAERVVSTLEAHNPVDLEERASEYGGAGQTKTASTATAATSAMGTASTASGTAAQAGTTAMQGSEQVVPLAEEKLEVGKRAVQKGTARVRRYVVERPAEEQIRLRNEWVSVERRPVSGSANVAPDSFTEKVIEVAETTEEPVVSKTARVVEEVVVGKQAEERRETVRDTVRREEVEVEGSAR